MPDRSPAHHLAQVNVSLLKAPLDSPQLADFVNALEPVNALADAAPGFVWRLKTDEGDATSLRVFGDDRILINLSVWASVEALRTFVYRGRHFGVLARRREWFDKIQEATVALWWLPIGQLPTVEDAKYRLDRIRRDGPTPEAFTSRKTFAPPAVAGGAVAPPATEMAGSTAAGHDPVSEGEARERPRGQDHERREPHTVG